MLKLGSGCRRCEPLFLPPYGWPLARDSLSRVERATLTAVGCLYSSLVGSWLLFRSLLHVSRSLRSLHTCLLAELEKPTTTKATTLTPRLSPRLYFPLSLLFSQPPKTDGLHSLLALLPPRANTRTRVEDVRR